MMKVFILFCFVVCLCTRYCSCWVFNDVDYAKLGAKFISDNDTKNEIDVIDDLGPEGRISLIFPGTKWCGAGNIADNDEDLGYLAATDKCCRKHDFCPDLIPAGQTRQNLTNGSFYTRLHCSCDEEFRQCLHDTKTTSSNAVGRIYFNALGNQCYRKDYRVTGCEQRGGFLNSKCLKYKYDVNGEKLYQWFDVPLY